jgi:hypothetical protein
MSSIQKIACHDNVMHQILLVKASDPSSPLFDHLITPASAHITNASHSHVDTHLQPIPTCSTTPTTVDANNQQATSMVNASTNSSHTTDGIKGTRKRKHAVSMSRQQSKYGTLWQISPQQMHVPVPVRSWDLRIHTMFCHSNTVVPGLNVRLSYIIMCLLQVKYVVVWYNNIVQHNPVNWSIGASPLFTFIWPSCKACSNHIYWLQSVNCWSNLSSHTGPLSFTAILSEEVWLTFCHLCWMIF